MPADQPTFQFERLRGIVWVCDIANSANYLNDDATANAIERFLPRLHWTARIMVEAAGGEFLEWTGDGFLAWFPVPLIRDLGTHASLIVRAAWELAVLVNVTKLDVDAPKPFRLRHGVTVEHDALKTVIHDREVVSVDLIGRAVILAFRQCGVDAGFPRIVTQREIVQALRSVGFQTVHFERWIPSAEERLKYFKGEVWGTRSLYVSAEQKHRPKSTRGVLREVRAAVDLATDARTEADAISLRTARYLSEFMGQMLSGPTWARTSANEYDRFFRERVLGPLRELIPLLEEMQKHETKK